MRTDELDFDLPPALIARRPAEPRDAARLMVLVGDRPPQHRFVRELPDLLQTGDALVFNTSAVIPARLIARRETGRRTEGLASHPIGDDPCGAWRVHLRGSARLRPGERLRLDAPPDRSDAARAALRLLERDGEAWRVVFETIDADGDWNAADGWSLLTTCGWTPLPPYILKARADDAAHGKLDPETDEAHDRTWYQTVYADAARADAARRGSIAAPTAGLHFTAAMLERAADRGIDRIDVTLHVGEGTFRPVTAETLEEHQMHTERFEVSAASIDALRRTRRAGGRIIAVGSTAARTLESLADGTIDQNGGQSPQAIIDETRLLIAPPYRFRHLDGLLTNFHLPRSTLLAMVGALVGLDRLKAAYAEAIAHHYRFFSYGDAMLILPDCGAPRT